MKRILSILLVIVLLISMVPITARAATKAAITTQPKNAVAPEGTTATVSFTAAGDGLTYTWYYKDTGASSFSKTSTFTGNTYTAEMINARNGRQIYCVVKDKYGNSVKTNTVTLTMADPLTIKTQPTVVTADVGDQVSFTVTATGGVAPYTYQWQYRDYYLDWANISGSWASGETTDQLDIWVDLSDFDAEIKYRCVITDAAGNTVISDAVYVKEKLRISIQPQNQTGSEGDTLTFTVMASDGIAPYTYQWYMKAQSGQWIESSDTTSTYRFEVNAVTVLQTYSFYCVVTDADGNSVTSATAVFIPS